MLAWTAGAAAATLDGGPGAPFGLPCQAVGAAQAGDTVRSAPGIYADCAIIAQDCVTIAGNGPGVVLADKTCGGKAIAVTRANDVIIRDLTLLGARVPDRNDAGIRAEGGGLTVERVTFSDNENGLLAADNPRATILVVESTLLPDAITLNPYRAGMPSGISLISRLAAPPTPCAYQSILRTPGIARNGHCDPVCAHAIYAGQ